MSFAEITADYRFKKGTELFQEGHYKAAALYLKPCTISENLTYAQRQEAMGILEKISKIQTNV
jgi:hypothetical protein